MQKCEVYYLGLVPYQKAWDLQRTLADEVASGARPPTLLLLEHPHTYTFGRRGNPDNLRWTPEVCQQKGIEILWVDRGGDITYHGPGQLVGYPILPIAPGGIHAQIDVALRLPKADYVGYIRRLETTIIQTLSAFGVAGKQIEGITGVWIPSNNQETRLPSKIAAIGVKVNTRGISQHGFAINIAPDMSFWEGIIGCGLKDYPIIRLIDIINEPIELSQVIKELAAAFGEVFSYQMEWKRNDHLL